MTSEDAALKAEPNDINDVIMFLKAESKKWNKGAVDPIMLRQKLKPPFVWALEAKDWAELVQAQCYWSDVCAFLRRHDSVAVGSLILVNGNYNRVAKKFSSDVLYEVDEVQVLTTKPIADIPSRDVACLVGLMQLMTFEQTKTIELKSTTAEFFLLAACCGHMMPVEYSMATETDGSTITVSSSLLLPDHGATKEFQFKKMVVKTERGGIVLATKILQSSLRLTKLTLPATASTGVAESEFTSLVLALSKAKHIREVSVNSDVQWEPWLSNLLLILSNPSLRSLSFKIKHASQDIGQTGVSKIVDSLKYTGKLEKLELPFATVNHVVRYDDYYDINAMGRDPIAAATKQNKSMRILKKLALDGDTKLISLMIGQQHICKNRDIWFDFISQHVQVFEALQTSKQETQKMALEVANLERQLKYARIRLGS
mmetsp:Transcript_12693/g.35033  ORF Transcript_12693/g.35033 Transcript_12693/m.35033 type:complete len:428 (-) Transcript_12693:1219-2502(-)|eukprot:CAMPEP_0198123250 /NCGR_PEP_ID=MMETSP1442-20131203/37084_1 /TAXON_ID= /ORGANISM="Craspedostauros australis, Strain CCMP3328" /LENGTH=427 /DNA_ID=CAMNT_0043782423 /DNA_START=137 /DNA_END=1420 /DNA_ORIENTATION=-